MARRQSSGAQPGPLHGLARTLAVLVCAVLGVLLLVGLGDTASIQGLRGLLGARQATIGLVAGHWQNDSGAVCPDGLQEVEITLDVARRTANLLRRQGYEVLVLPEYAAQLDGFRAEAFLAIHADSCVELSGFKIARMTQAEEPAEEELLVQMLEAAYAEATGLQPHPDTITDDMLQYHALRRIAPETPGAIIEIGFMGGDRYLLTEEPERVAVGIANGLMAFLRRNAEPTPTNE
jgi:N-acetylmuramoyl-L-alanine amidase